MQTPTKSLTSPPPPQWVERIFGRMAAMYGARFADMWRGCNLGEVKGTWAHSLTGYSADEIARGLQACTQHDWPPTLPEFLRMCRAAPDLEAEFVKAVEQMRLRAEGKDSWPNPVFYWAAVRIGGDLLNMPYSAIKRRWKAAIDEVSMGGSLNPVPPRLEALPAPGGQTLQADRVREIIDGLKAKLTGGLVCNR